MSKPVSPFTKTISLFFDFVFIAEGLMFFGAGHRFFQHSLFLVKLR